MFINRLNIRNSRNVLSQWKRENGNKIVTTAREKEFSYLVLFPDTETPVNILPEIAFLCCTSDDTLKSCTFTDWLERVDVVDFIKIYKTFTTLYWRTETIVEYSAEINLYDIFRDLNPTYTASMCFLVLKHRFDKYETLFEGLGSSLGEILKSQRLPGSDRTYLSKPRSNFLNLITLTVALWLVQNGLWKLNEDEVKRVVKLWVKVKAKLGDDAYNDYLKFKQGNLKIDELTDHFMDDSLAAEDTKHSSVCSEAYKDFLYLTGPRLIKLVTDASKVEERTMRQIDACEAEVAKYRKQAKESKEAKETAQKQLRQSNAELKNLRDNGVVDSSEYKATIRNLEVDKQELQADLQEYKRKAEKQQAELLTQSNVISQLKAELAESNGRVTTVLQQNNSTDQVPTTVLVKLLKDYTIVVCGGDAMYPRLREFNLDKLKLYGLEDNALTRSALKDADLIVIATGYNTHSNTSMPVSYARDHSIPLTYFNGLSVDGLIRSICTALYK